MWWDELGAEGARSLLGSLNDPPETVMRANTLRTTPHALRAGLEAAGEALAPSGEDGLLDPQEALRWEGPLGEAALGALGDGRMFAQSRGAQAVVGMLDPRAGERVLDLCAGPGVKTTAIAARMEGAGEVVAVEQDPARARQISELAGRAGADNIRVVVADATASLDGAPNDQGYDRVLVDPPCSDLGTLASRPDARWRKDPATIERLAAVQAEILNTGIAALRPGGTLVYSTCTISRRENEGVVATAMASNPGLESVRRLDTRPDRDGTDGFFIAEFQTGKSGV
jgi:16S rRNA (cytosine967-C5)-methyltransferase